jgi:hypothetical protein
MTIQAPRLAVVCVQRLETEVPRLQETHTTGRERLAKAYFIRNTRKSASVCQLRPSVKNLSQLRSEFDFSWSERGMEARRPPAWKPVNYWRPRQIRNQKQR